MNTTDFTYLLQHPQKISTIQVSDVRSVIDEFPYFQSARAIYLKALKDKESFKYNHELKLSAAYTTDRSVLFDFITSEEFIQNDISDQIKQNIEHVKDIVINDLEDISVNHSVVIDDALRAQIKETEPVLDPSLFEAKQDTITDTKAPLIQVESTDIEKTPEEKLEIGKPLNFDKTEMHSFSEWLKITSFKPIIRNSEIEKQEVVSESSESKKAEKFELIDKFIQNNPKISPVKQDFHQQNIANERMIQPESLMTETLARIYLEQKNYKKAIQAYKILSLKYPEKSGFFADQIQAVKDLQEQNKKQ